MSNDGRMRPSDQILHDDLIEAGLRAGDLQRVRQLLMIPLPEDDR